MISGINQNTKANNPQGGIVRIAAVPLKDVNLAGSTITSGKIALALSAYNQKLYIPETMTAKMNSTGSFVGNSHRSAIEGTLEFPGIDAATFDEGLEISKIPAWVLVVEYANCLIVVYGVDIVTGCSANPELRASLQKTRLSVSNTFGTIDEEDKLILTVSGTARSGGVLLNIETQTFDQFLALSA